MPERRDQDGKESADVLAISIDFRHSLQITGHAPLPRNGGAAEGRANSTDRFPEISSTRVSAKINLIMRPSGLHTIYDERHTS